VRLFLLDGRSLSRPPEAGDVVTLDPEESRHLVSVLRARPGDPIQLADGRGRYLDGVVARASAAGATVTLTAARDDPWETAGPRLELACALVKGQRFEWALEKAVELGAHAIQPLLAERGVVLPGLMRRRRWASLLRAATKQAGRSFVPELGEPVALAALVAHLGDKRLFYGEEEARRGDDPARATAPEGPLGAIGPCAALVWTVGPEGGWSDGERALLAAAGTPVRLGPHRLRTETAAMAGLVLLQSARERLAAAGLP
jgi:16S rRNA (uracil1498-N3)-methyltransferase